MVGGDEQAHLPRRAPPQRWWVAILKAVSLSLLLFPFSTGGKWQFEFEPETRPLPSALAPGGELWGGGGRSDCRECAECRECAVCRGVCGV